MISSNGIKTLGFYSNGGIVISSFIDFASFSLWGNAETNSLLVPKNEPVCFNGSGVVEKCYVGTCGTANGQQFLTAPSGAAALCQTGSSSSVTGTGSSASPWAWTCSAYGGTTSCQATQGAVVCGTAATQGTLTKPTTNLCPTGETPTAVTAASSCPYVWNWKCSLNGTTTQTSSNTIQCNTILPSTGSMTFTAGSYSCPTPQTLTAQISALGGGGGGAGEAMEYGTGQSFVCPTNSVGPDLDMGYNIVSRCPSNGGDTKFNGTVVAKGGWHGIMGANKADNYWEFTGKGGLAGKIINGITGSTSGGSGSDGGIGYGGGGGTVSPSVFHPGGINYGGGGSGGGYGSSHSQAVIGGGGGAGGYVLNYPVSFGATRTTSLMSIIVGAGGPGGIGGGGGSSGGYSGNNGASGLLKISW